MTWDEAMYLTVPYGVDMFDAMEARRYATGYPGGFEIKFERAPQPVADVNGGPGLERTN
jgi:hypothetical protein